ncbi:hypothetical protein BOTBODRAFT_35158 [Botryobasidium botryosum FD-172 SS1]|uniref:Protein kinase domain-containing protein n=1 Tax=Botryobasidium botryosum (strain FD-172 SS1) TaxID=930990 RepID=A0A067M7H8_BOTB1|nr:hypothetical protein BOTBODRAFT_35158 [Botryobasidium botryosum FD-172 SS1]
MSVEEVDLLRQQLSELKEFWSYEHPLRRASDPITLRADPRMIPTDMRFPHLFPRREKTNEKPPRRSRARWQPYGVTSAPVRNTAASPVAYGGFADIHCGDLITESATPVKVAVKVMRTGVLNASGEKEPLQKTRRRLHREFSVLEKLDHPGITKLWGYSDDFGPLPAIVSSWCPHGDARSYLRDNPNADRTKMLVEVTAAVEYLHTSRPPIVHGDIKAANVFIKENGECCLGDFGLSRCLQEEPTGLTSTGVSGTSRWMAPELLFNERGGLRTVTKASDIWALGCLYLQIMTGEIPWERVPNNAKVIILVHKGETPPRPKGEVAARLLHDDLWRVIRSCWRYDDRRRPEISTVQEDLRHVLEKRRMHASSPPDRRPLRLVLCACLTAVALLLYIYFV